MVGPGDRGAGRAISGPVAHSPNTRVNGYFTEASGSSCHGGWSPICAPLPPLTRPNPPAQVNERYPKDVEKRQKRLAALSEALASGISTEMDLQRLQAQATTLHNQITEIQERKVAQDKARQVRPGVWGSGTMRP